MPRPKSKIELLKASEQNYQKLIQFTSDLTLDVRNSDFIFGTLNRNIRDVLAHLHHWHLLFLSWYNVGMKGEKPSIPAKGYTWKTTSELNRWINSKYSNVEIEIILDKLEDSHQKIMMLIEQHSNDELFQKKRYKWTGSTSLGAYTISSTSSHYDWALKLIKRSLK